MFIYTSNQHDIKLLKSQGLKLMKTMDDGTHIFCCINGDLTATFSEDELEASTITDIVCF